MGIDTWSMDVNWITLAQDTFSWWIFVTMTIRRRLHQINEVLEKKECI
jgi:hypothetical protein